MTKTIFAALGFAAALFATSAQAHYQTIIPTTTTAVTDQNQRFSTTYALDGNTYTNVWVGVVAKGDYGVNLFQSDEYFNLFVDGLQVAHWSSSGGSNYTVDTNAYGVDYTLSGYVGLTDAQWAAFSADNKLNITWQNGTGVTPSSLGGADYVSFNVLGILSSVATAPVTTTPVTTTPVTTTPVTTSPQPVTSVPTTGSTANAVPEPGSIALLGLGLAALGFAHRRRKG